jgi:hypothetical protein
VCTHRQLQQHADQPAQRLRERVLSSSALEHSQLAQFSQASCPSRAEVAHMLLDICNNLCNAYCNCAVRCGKLHRLSLR